MTRNVKVKDIDADRPSCGCGPARRRNTKKSWEAPKIEDVSGKIMAQPYIRFT